MQIIYLYVLTWVWKMNIKMIIAAISIAILIIAIGSYTLLSNNSKITETIDKKEIRIGALLPLTGSVGVLGIEMQRGIELAANDINKNNNYSIKLVFEDSEYPSPAKSVTASKKLVEIDDSDVVIASIVEDIKPVMAIYEERKIPLVAIWDSNKPMEDAGEYIFSIGFSTEKAGEIMADFAFYNLSSKKNIHNSSY